MSVRLRVRMRTDCWFLLSFLPEASVSRCEAEMKSENSLIVTDFLLSSMGPCVWINSWDRE